MTHCHPKKFYLGWCLYWLCTPSWLCTLSLAQASLAQAQTFTVFAPDAKAVTPGDYVTLVFRVEASAPAQIEASAESAFGWTLLRQPGLIEIKDQVRLVPVTVEIPTDAAAGVVDKVTFSLASGESASVQLTVKEQRVLELQAPANLVLGKENLRALLGNKGNVVDQVMLELSYGGTVLESRELELEPQTQEEQLFEIQNEGLYLLKLSNQQGLEVTRAITVIRFGVPVPEPLGLLGQWQSSLDTDLDWQSILALGGSLSDFWTLDAFIEGPNPRRSFLEFSSSPWSLRFGEARRRPFGVSFLPPVGLSLRNSKDGASVLASLGWVRERQFAFYLLEAYESQNVRVSVGTGISAGKAFGAARYRFRYPESDADIHFEYFDGALDITAETKTFDAPGELEGAVEVLNLGKDTALVQFRTNYNVDTLLMYSSVTLPLGSKATDDWTVGLSNQIPANFPGELGFGVQWSSVGGFASLRYFHKLGAGWQASHQVGVTYDQKGLGWSLDTRWSAVQDTYFSIDAQTVLYQDAPYEASLEAKLEIPFAKTLEAFSEAKWDIDDQNLGLNVGALWQVDQWGFEVSSDVSYDYSGSFQPWSADLRLKGSFNFELQVPEDITTDFAGRNVGRVSGIVQGGGIPIPDVQLEIDRFRILTDAQGRFNADLPPGDYTLKLDKSSLPITYRLITPEKQDLTIVLQQEIQVNFDTIATAALAGRALLDTDGNGEADTPNQGVEVQFILSDAEGLKRVVKTNQEGDFLLRGLLPGSATLKLTGLPLGSILLGSNQRSLLLSAGQVSEVLFVIQPPTTISQNFSEADLRIRRVSLEVDQVPAGTAPLVQVTIQGEPERVILQTATDTIELESVGKAWEGRLPIPLQTPEGVYPFTVTASLGQGQTSKKAQVIINPEAPALELTLSSPVRPGETLVLEVTTYFDGTEFQVTNELGLPFNLQGSKGHYQAEVVVPKDTPDKIYPLTLETVSSLGARFKQESTFRILVVE
jgi:hypothetical protein